MSDGWKRASEMAKKHSDNLTGMFVKLKPNEKIVCAICGEPYPYKVKWQDGRTQIVPDDSDIQANFRTAINCYIFAEKKMKILDMGINLFKDVEKVKDKYSLDKKSYEIQRHGEGTKTTYSILPDEPITDEQKNEINASPLNDLEGVITGDGNSSDTSTSSDNSKNNLIDPKISSEMIVHLKNLPQSAIDDFLKKFYVKRVRDLRAFEQATAWDFIKTLESKYALPTANSEKEVDPFS